MTANWDLNHLLGYLATWSAVKEFRTRTANDPLKAVAEKLREVWGQEDVNPLPGRCNQGGNHQTKRR